MRKLLLAYENEMIKISRKPVVIVLLILILVSTMISGVIFNKGKDILTAIESSSVAEDQEDTNYEEALDELKKENTKMEELLKSLPDGEQKLEYESNIEYNKRQIELINLAKEKEIDLAVNIAYSDSGEASVYSYCRFNEDNENDFINLALSKMVMYNENSYYGAYENIGLGEFSDNKNQLSLYEKFKKSIENNDYAAYIDACNYELKYGDNKEKDENLSEEMNALRLKADPKGKHLADINDIIKKIEAEKKSLLYNKDMTSVTNALLDTGSVLSPEERAKIENELSISMYKLENGIYGSEDDTSKIINTFSVGQFFIIVLVLLIAGSSVSTEMSTGSIKTLIISPVKRWKIFLTKYLSIITVGLAGMLLSYILSILMNIIFNGFYVTSYVCVLGNSIFEINGYLFHLLYDLVQFTDVLIFSALAFMLSIITRNTAVSVAMSLVAYFGGTIVNLIQVIFRIKNIVTGDNVVAEWIKFIPYNNTANSLSKYIFSYLDDSSISGMLNVLEVPQTLLFVVIYMLVLFACIMYTAYDSFTRRDIK